MKNINKHLNQLYVLTSLLFMVIMVISCKDMEKTEAKQEIAIDQSELGLTYLEIQGKRLIFDFGHVWHGCYLKRAKWKS
jgi:hypothetical protein